MGYNVKGLVVYYGRFMAVLSDCYLSILIISRIQWFIAFGCGCFFAFWFHIVSCMGNMLDLIIKVTTKHVVLVRLDQGKARTAVKVVKNKKNWSCTYMYIYIYIYIFFCLNDNVNLSKWLIFIAYVDTLAWITYYEFVNHCLTSLLNGSAFSDNKLVSVVVLSVVLVYMLSPNCSSWVIF